MAAEMITDPANAAREFMTEWTSDGSLGAVFGPDLLDQCAFTDFPLVLDPDRKLRAFAACDLALTGDSSALSIVRFAADQTVELASLKRWKPTKKQPLKPSQVIGAVLKECERHNVRLLASDVHLFESLKEAAESRPGLRIIAAPSGSAGKRDTHEAAQLMMGGAFRMGRDHQLLRSLMRITASRSPDGAIKIRAPRTKGNHGDDASALVLALWLAHQHGGRIADPPFTPGPPSAYQQQLGLIDAQGRPTTNNAHTEFSIGPDGHAYASSASRQSGWASGSGSSFGKQNGF